jgi:hypothetical protein
MFQPDQFSQCVDQIIRGSSETQIDAFNAIDGVVPMKKNRDLFRMTISQRMKNRNRGPTISVIALESVDPPNVARLVAIQHLISGGGWRSISTPYLINLKTREPS